MRRIALLAPVFGAMLPVVFLYSHNTYQLDIASLVGPLVVVVIGSMLLVGALLATFRDAGAASVVGTTWVLVFFLYGPIHDVVAGWELGEVVWGRNIVLVPAAFLIAALPVLGVSVRNRFSKDIVGNLAKFMPALAIAMALLTVYNLGVSAVARSPAPVGNGPLPIERERGDVGAEITNAPAPDKLPDIYYIVPDGYAGSVVLKDLFGFDNSEFLGTLEQRGFYVARQARSNYVATFLSLTATLNMRYLDVFDTWLSEPSLDRADTYQMLENNDVGTLLMNSGYEFIQIGTSRVGPTEVRLEAGRETVKANANARGEEVIKQVQLRLAKLITSDLSIELSRATLAWPVLGNEWEGYWRGFLRIEMMKDNTEKIRQVPSWDSPTFAVLHLNLPHPPYDLDSECQNRPLVVNRSYDNSSGYVQQLICVNKTLEKIVDSILALSESEPIIMIQSDHGSNVLNGSAGPVHRRLMEALEDAGASPSRGPFSVENLSSIDQKAIRERTGILAAYYMPTNCRQELYPSITPVNSFRMILDLCLGTQLGLLVDQVYWSSYQAPYQFVHIDP